jgi:hypothetical protein
MNMRSTAFTKLCLLGKFFQIGLMQSDDTRFAAKGTYHLNQPPLNRIFAQRLHGRFKPGLHNFR